MTVETNHTSKGITDVAKMKLLSNLLLILSIASTTFAAPHRELSFAIERTVAHSGFDGTMCWVHARAGAIPAGQPGNDSQEPLVVMTMQKLLLSGSDVFYALNETRSADLGKNLDQAGAARVVCATDRGIGFSRQTPDRGLDRAAASASG